MGFRPTVLGGECFGLQSEGLLQIFICNSPELGKYYSYNCAIFWSLSYFACALAAAFANRTSAFSGKD